MNVAINEDFGWVDHNPMNFDDGFKLRAVILDTDVKPKAGLGFLKQEGLLDAAPDHPGQVTPDLYSAAVPMDAIDAVWNGNEPSPVGTVIETKDMITGRNLRLVLDEGNGMFPDSWRIEDSESGDPVAFLDHDLIGILRRGDRSFSAAASFESSIERLLEMLAGDHDDAYDN